MSLSREGRSVRCALIVAMIAAGAVACTHSTPWARAQRAPTLKDAFAGVFRVGAALNANQFTERDAKGAALIKAQFNTTTPENVLKWEVVHPQPDKYDFTQSDQYVAFGEANGMFIVGHTLVWHSQTPRWVFQDANGAPLSRDALLARMRDHIHTVVGRYKGRVKGWDVVNEALNEDGTMRRSPWFTIIGDDFIAKAFEYAHEADPAAELYYNDYNLEVAAKRNGAAELVKRLKAQGIPIAGVGSQTHEKLYNTGTAAKLDTTISVLGALGVKVNITELDVDVLPAATQNRTADVGVTAQQGVSAALNPYATGLPDAVQQALAQRYAALFRVFLKHRGTIDRVTFWGVGDGDSWLNNWPMRGRTNYPLLFDRQDSPKPAFDAVLQTVRQVVP
jgi:endo-1,4-beta-xylanase